ncbi:hypothetical protein L208DRAFT_1385791 [Tricholoma matsutake]|nr:hypothetical protein L208DRAFT_1407103 [Tricholoma matsutake 945]KAF8239764.1 hypothetical protein L208DRAFT_1385791 [Tricholoma matsutake 945]
MEVEEEDRLDTWVGDVESVEQRGKVGTARAVLAYALKVFPERRICGGKQPSWKRLMGPGRILMLF